MPDNHTALYDYHEHVDHHDATTHSHDDHPRHHHDANGSIHYYPAPGVVDVHNRDDINRRTDAAWDRDPDDSDLDRLLAELIGERGYDITHRTR